MFESLSKKLDDIRRRIFSGGRLTEKNIEDGIREIRAALLDADVNFQVVKNFIKRVKEKAIGEELIKSVQPGQQIVKIVYDELVSLMGEEDHSLNMSDSAVTTIMMVGLQGSGKTTTCGKLAQYLKEKGHRPLLVAADIQRPAAIEQLKVLGEKLEVAVFADPKSTPPEICKRSLSFAREQSCDVVILDTAGRLHIDSVLMDELHTIQKKVSPNNIFLVCDAMTGQDAVNSAREFNAQLELDGVILTKLDGDARGGAALSIRAVTNKPIKFIGVGEKLDALREFRPASMASRILGMGDVVELVDIAQKEMSEEKALELQEKLQKAAFTLDDFLEQFQMMKKLGGIGGLLDMLPGGLGKLVPDKGLAEKQFVYMEAMIYSMTPLERQNPDMIDGKRRQRIAKGSGTTVQDINDLLRSFREMRNMMKKMGKMQNMLRGMGLSGLSGLGNLSSLSGMGSLGGMPEFPIEKEPNQEKSKSKKK